jgi:hypothetical protein
LAEDRRQYERFVPCSPLLVHLGEYTGHLSNLCEGGLAVEGLFPKIWGETFCVELELPNSKSPLEATAQIAWTSDSENRTGVHFVHLAATSRQQLGERLSAQVAVTVEELPPQTIRAPITDTLVEFAGVRPPLTSGVDSAEVEAAKPHDRLRRLASLTLGIVTLCSAFLVLGYYLGSKRGYGRTQMMVSAATTPDLPARAEVEPAGPSPATNPLSSAIPLSVPGFVLQIDELTDEADADGLSEILQHHDFPAFVFKRNNDRFYKVAVGNFADAESAAVVKRELEKRGFKAVLQHWSPY